MGGVLDNFNLGQITALGNGNYPQTNGYMQIVNQQGCSGNSHVWVCDHTEKCRCGKASRQVQPKLCPGCGREH